MHVHICSAHCGKAINLKGINLGPKKYNMSLMCRWNVLPSFCQPSGLSPLQGQAQCSSITPHQHKLDLMKIPGSLNGDENTFWIERFCAFCGSKMFQSGAIKRLFQRWKQAEHNETVG